MDVYEKISYWYSSSDDRMLIACWTVTLNCVGLFLDTSGTLPQTGHTAHARGLDIEICNGSYTFYNGRQSVKAAVKI